MMHKKYLSFFHKFSLALTICCFGGSFSIAYAQDWQARIYDYALPQRIVAIDKNEQKFYLYEKKSPLRLKLSYPCTTGQVLGDKQVVNDKRTPEGVYFIEYKIAKGLDFKEYGGVAYTLNYPNPVDKLRGKTGYGIWIHSKGEDADIIPLNTRGCIAIERKDIIEVGPMLLPGTAVVVGETLNTSQVPMEDSGIAKHLRLRMEQWTRAWASRSDKFFDFYDAGAYSKAMPESFNAFKSNKERLFKHLAWINIFNREVHVLEGPGYWVTWSEQFYRAPNLSTEGVRRLYWQRDKGGQFRIVGMEWIPRNVGMQAAYEKGQLVAASQTIVSDALPSDVQKEVPVPPPLSMPETEENVEQATKPKQSQVAQASVNAQGRIILTSEVSATIQKNVDARSKAWQAKDAKTFYGFYNTGKYGKVRNVPAANIAELKNAMDVYFKAPWLDMISGKVQMVVRGDSLLTIGKRLIYIPGKKVIEGEEYLYWQLDDKNRWKIVGSEWKSKRLGMEAAYLEKISTSISKFVTSWRADWLAANVKAYMTYYAPNAKQGARDKAAIAAQKQALWANASPAEIKLSGLRVQLDDRGVRADMMQVYRDKNNKGDKGTKTLILAPHGDSWRIVLEEWAASPTD